MRLTDTAPTVLLRSIWTALRIVFDFKRTELFKWVSISLGVGLPILFLVIVMPVAGVSYRLYNVCIPNGQAAFNSWFIWLLLFSALSTVILILTILYCLWKFALSALAKGRGGAGFGHVSSTSQDTTSSTGMAAPGSKPTVRAVRRKKRVEWARIKRVLYLQWRTILLAFVVLNETIFFGLVFVQQTAAIEQSSHGITASDAEWGLCLIETGGDVNACLPLSGGLGLSEPRVVATLLLAAVSPFPIKIHARRKVQDTDPKDLPDPRHHRLPPHAPRLHVHGLVRAHAQPTPAPQAVQPAPTERGKPGLHHAGQPQAHLAQHAAGV